MEQQSGAAGEDRARFKGAGFSRLRRWLPSLGSLVNGTAARRLVWSVFAAGMAYIVLPQPIPGETRILAAWDMLIVSFLGLAYAKILPLSPDETGRSVRPQDQSVPIILLLVILAVGTSLFAIGFMLAHQQELPVEARVWFVLLSGIAIIGSWLMTHTMFALHYAHRYYGDKYEPLGVVDEGLSFPGGSAPDYMDFVYFAFVIGMTAQVSDVQVTSREMRRLVLLHSLLSFAFYTGILALTVNVMADIL
jgi:uncharacterized membrane protein